MKNCNYMPSTKDIMAEIGNYLKGVQADDFLTRRGFSGSPPLCATSFGRHTHFAARK